MFKKTNTAYQDDFKRLVYQKKNPTNDLPEIDGDDLQELKQAFDLFDAKGKGRITPAELLRFFVKCKLDKTRPSMFKMVQSMDTPENNEDGMTFEGFMEGVMNYYGDRYTEEGVRHIFELFDEDGDGVITKEAFR